jgi:hypothetical protein
MVNTTRPKTTLDDFKPTPRAENHVTVWDSNIVEDDLAVSMRSVIVAVN